MATFMLHDLRTIKIDRGELNTASDCKSIRIKIIATDTRGEEHDITLFGKSFDNWTEASKELQFSKQLPNTIFIEHADKILDF